MPLFATLLKEKQGPQDPNLQPFLFEQASCESVKDWGNIESSLGFVGAFLRPQGTFGAPLNQPTTGGLHMSHTDGPNPWMGPEMEVQGSAKQHM